MPQGGAGSPASHATRVTGVAAGVPFVAVPPTTAAGASAPVVVAWHLTDPPRTEAALAAALPLDGLDAWRIYLGLPLYGSRTPPGGLQEVMRRWYQDAVLNMQGPITNQAAAEFEPALAELRRRLNLSARLLGVVGGSLGAAVAQLVAAEGGVDIAAAVLVSPLVQLRPAVGSHGPALRRHLSLVGPLRGGGAAAGLRGPRRRGRRAPTPTRGPAGGRRSGRRRLPPQAADLRDALAGRYQDPGRVDLIVVPRMAHALAEEPGLQPAPQTAPAVEVDRLAVGWLRRHLPTG
jgi:hypothetical protein